MASPMPRLAPVTSAVLCSSRMSTAAHPTEALSIDTVNRLTDQTSPYLRQHADNPVDWHPWGDDAFERARAEDKPLFVSIGYASCHWCHVMAHESFEDSATAADLDRWFVSVKVDREERPDVDALYMTAVQATTGSGGWPMSVFCTPDGRPFFAGTYFPPTDRHGMPSFRRVLAAVADAWRERRADVEAQAEALAEAVASEATFLDRLADAQPGARMPQWRPTLDRLVATLAERFDPRWGGFGPAPKFPRPTLVELCLRHHAATGDERSLTMATTTLDAMAAGGMYDHLAGGFARYSTDERWLVPHFEKMLTDQALLARAYLHAWQATGSADYLQVASETLEYVLTELAAPSGGLCSSVDADADGVEGGHATWTRREALDALAAAGLGEVASEICDWYGITEEGNWEGRSVPHRPLGASLQRPAHIERGRAALLDERRRRPQPARDDKILTEWNAMFVAVLAEAAAACGNDAWAHQATAIADALFSHNRRTDGRWLRSGANGATGESVAAGAREAAGRAPEAVPAFAADHAWVVEGCIRLAELTGEARWTALAADAASSLLDLFWDAEKGGLFTTGHDAGHLIVRGKDVLDGAVPSTAATAAQAFLRLAGLTGEPRWRDAAEQLVVLAAPVVESQPLAVADMLAALSLAEGGIEVVVAGERPDLLTTVRRHWLPDAVTAWGEPTPSPLWEGRAPGAAYVCRHFSCLEPARGEAALETQLVPLAVSASR